MTHGHVHEVLRAGKSGTVEIVGFAEPNRDLAMRLVHQYGYDSTLIYASLDEMLAQTQPELVAAYNSIFQHLEVVEACAPKGIHVMVEKPLAVSMEHAQRMKDLVEEYEIHLLTNYETTWYGSNHEVYARIHEQAAIGEIRKMVIHDGHEGPREIGCNEEFLEWLTDPIQNGAGALMDFGCYGANLMTWLMKNERPVSVMALTQQIKPNEYPHVDDEATILVEYPKAQGIIQASWNWPFNRKDTHVYGQHGYLQTIDGRKMRIRLQGDKEESEWTAPARKAPQDNPFSFLVAVIRGDIAVDNTLSSLENNLIAMEILEAAKRSAETGKRVVFPIKK